MALLLAACGGGGADSTTTTAGDAATTSAAAEATTTTGATTTVTEEDDGGASVSIDDIPQECLDSLAEFLREIEPIVEPIDWENATIEDLDEIAASLEEPSVAYSEQITDTACDQVDVEASDEESFEFMIDFAESEAPGTVGYLEWIRDFAGAMSEGTGTESSGDCETDIAAIQAIVDEGVPMSQLPLSEMGSIGSLVTSISMNCSAERAGEFFSQADVAAFLESSG